MLGSLNLKSVVDFGLRRKMFVSLKDSQLEHARVGIYGYSPKRNSQNSGPLDLGHLQTLNPTSNATNKRDDEDEVAVAIEELDKSWFWV